MVFLSASFIIPVILVFWSRFSLERAAGGQVRDKVGMKSLMVTAFGGFWFSAVIGLYAGSDNMVAVLVAATLFSLAALSAYIDHHTAWAPDGTILLLVCLIMAAGLLLETGLVQDLAPAAITGLGVFMAAQALWFFQCRAGMPVLTPPDQIALVAPLLLFGFSAYTGFSFLVMAVLLLLLLKGPEALYRRLRGPAADEALAHADLVRIGKSERSAPFLPVAMTALILTLILHLLIRQG